MIAMRKVAIASAARTAIGKFQGTLAPLSAVELGGIAVAAALDRAGVDRGSVDEVVLGQTLQAGCGQNPARQAAMRAGLPETVPAYTVNKVCGSGLKAVCLGALSLAAGEAEVVVAGGMESMTRAPHLLAGARGGWRLGDAAAVDELLKDGLIDAFDGSHMGVTAETVAQRHRITRAEADAFAFESQQRAARAQAAGRFRDEIVPVPVPRRGGDAVLFEQDEFPRPDVTIAGLAGLKPAFREDGVCTAGNSSRINDGAAAVVLVAADEVARRGLTPLATIRSFASAALDPKVMGLGPVPAVRKALAKAGLELGDVDLFELNKAFATQSLAVIRELELDPARVNVNGGAIALGHPIGASGARVLVTLLHALRARDARVGVAALCIGGGQGVAMVVER
jgi:acetyl-CoA C-acetyltransferase